MHTNWLSRVRYILRGLGGLVLLGAIAARSLPALLALLVLVGLGLLILSVTLYRPPEDHLAAVYRLDRFARWCAPDRWMLMLPWLETVRREISLRPDVMRVALPHIPLRDRVGLAAEMTVRLQFDPRHVAKDLRTTVLNLPPIALHKAVEDRLQIAATDIIGRFTVDQALDPAGFALLGQRLSRRLAQLVFPLGLIVDDQFGVSILHLKADSLVQQAWQHKVAGQLEGEADLARLNPILAQIARYPTRAAMNVLLTEYAATLATTDQLPATILNTQPPSDGLALNSLLRVLSQDAQTPPLTLKPGVGQGKKTA